MPIYMLDCFYRTSLGVRLHTVSIIADNDDNVITDAAKLSVELGATSFQVRLTSDEVNLLIYRSPALVQNAMGVPQAEASHKRRSI